MAAVGGLLVAFGAASAQAAFPGSNGRIAFVRGDPGDIYTVEPGGGGLVALTATQAAESDPVWSADGTRLAFSRSQGRRGAAIFVMDVARRVERRVTSGEELDSQPSWSPDGRSIAFTRRGDIHVVGLDGGRARNLTADELEAFDHDPAWSPDGRRIAWAKSFVEDDVYVMDADGSRPTRLTTYAFRDSHPEWSPDGRQLAFTRSSSVGEGGLYVIDAQGDGERALTVNQPEGDETRFDSEPAWAPDGSRIAFTRRTGGLFRLHLVHPGGGPATPLTAARVDEGQPDWQPLGANASPACSSVRAVPARLWPPNHRLVQVELRGATDADGDRLSAAIGGVTQDEPVREGRHGALASDARRAAGHRVFLRAERDPSGDGRVYRIPFAISDGRGGGCSGAVTVVVPRSSRHRAVDSGQQFDSFGS